MARTIQNESKGTGFCSHMEIIGLCLDPTVQMDVVNVEGATNGHHLIDVTITSHCTNQSHPTLRRVQKDLRSPASDREKRKHTQQYPSSRIGRLHKLSVVGIQEHGALGHEGHELVMQIA